MKGYWGKTHNNDYHLLAFHSLDVCACAIGLLKGGDRFCAVFEQMLGLTKDEVVNLFAWAACLHDIGKLSPAFQRQTEETSLIADILGVGFSKSPNDVRHDSLGWALWSAISRDTLGSIGVKNLIAPTAMLLCATGHHGKPPSSIGGGTRINVKSYFTDRDIVVAREWAIWATKHFNPKFPSAKLIESASWWIAGLITLADWIGSNTDYFTYGKENISYEEYLQKTLKVSNQAIVDSGVIEAQRRSFADLFLGFIPTPMQEIVNKLNNLDKPYFLIIEETTGGGKTEAALSAAGGSNFFFGLPTMATANGLWKRVESLGGQQALSHGKAWAVPKSMDRASAWLNSSSRRSLISDIGVGTIDQAMVGAMYARYNTLRLIGLAGKTLIIDEVHAYDIYMKTIQESLIALHAKAGGSVILLSATLPLSHREDYAKAWCNGAGVQYTPFSKDSFPLISHIDYEGKISEFDDFKSNYQAKNNAGRRVDVEFIHNEKDVYAQIIEYASSGSCVVWVRNTVSEAIDAYKNLKSQGVDVLLFHSRFVVEDRNRIEACVLDTFGKLSTPKQRCGKVLIATQVVEQSLDLDFDFMITDLCPVDLLIQRAGRLHRHNRGDRKTPRLSVYCPSITDCPSESWVSDWSNGSAYVYKDHGKLWLTQKLIEGGFTLPEDARKLVQGVYGDSTIDIPNGLLKSSISFSGAQLAQWSSGDVASINPESSYRSEGVPQWDDNQTPTRLGDRTIELVICERGKPITGNIETSSIQVRHRMIEGQPESGIDVGKYRKTLDLSNYQAQVIKSGMPATVAYSTAIGLFFNS